ncbi:MAG TPA: hypothetical protein VF477_08135, partial [Mycobacterium sp.]
ELEPEGIIVVAERVRVRQRFSGSVPGRADALGVNRQTGLLVCTRRRLYASIPTLARLAGPAIDQPWDSERRGPAKVALTESGVMLTIDLKRVDPRFSGKFSEEFKVDLDDDVLAALPTRSLAFEISPEYVFHSLGVRPRF